MICPTGLEGHIIGEIGQTSDKGSLTVVPTMVVSTSQTRIEQAFDKGSLTKLRVTYVRTCVHGLSTIRRDTAR